MTDPIADMLTRIRNAMAVNKPQVVLPFSNIKFDIAKLLKNNGYLKDVEKIEKGTQGNKFDELKLGLKYLGGKESVIQSIKRISKPGRRVYTTKDNLPTVLNNIGIAVISTSKGLMTNKEAKKSNIGGEIICEIY